MVLLLTGSVTVRCGPYILPVDDATTEPLAGCFMPTERQLGYCYVMYDILTKYGIPMSLYSDKHTIFRSSKEGNLTQFAK